MTDVGSAVRGITGSRLRDGGSYDLTIDDGIITAISPSAGRAAAGRAAAGHLHLPGWLLLPSAVEPHAHVDKAFSWQHVDPVYGDLVTAIDSWRTYSLHITTAEVHQRARRAFNAYLHSGITAVRTHVDLFAGAQPSRGLQAVLALREELRDIMHIEVVLLASPFDTADDIRDALSLGVDVMGGCPHLAPDPSAETRKLLDFAAEFGLPVDLHTDEQLDPAMLSIRLLAAEVTRHGLGGRATASHCVSLGQLEPEQLSLVAAEVAAAGLGIVSLPITNLYLQGRQHRTRTPRGLTALRALLAVGITVAAGSDNLRDAFNPMGRADPFETTSLLITAGHLDAEQALAAVTSAPRRLLGLPPSDITVGDSADLVALDCSGLTDALAGAAESRVVLYRGRLVSRSIARTESAMDLVAP